MRILNSMLSSRNGRDISGNQSCTPESSSLVITAVGI
jgi:hypothetical protein